MCRLRTTRIGVRDGVPFLPAAYLQRLFWLRCRELRPGLFLCVQVHDETNGGILTEENMSRALAAVRALHMKERVSVDLTVCAHCRTSFPCHTARAVSGAA